MKVAKCFNDAKHESSLSNGTKPLLLLKKQMNRIQNH